MWTNKSKDLIRAMDSYTTIYILAGLWRIAACIVIVNVTFTYTNKLQVLS